MPHADTRAWIKCKHTALPQLRIFTAPASTMLKQTLPIVFLTFLCGINASRDLPQRSLLQTQDGPQLPVGVLPPLPYAYDALEPFVDNLTMTLHHDKHFNSYVTALPALVGNNSQLQNLSLAELQRQAGTGVVSGAAAKTLQNSGGGTWNHGLFFKHLAPAGTQQAKYDTAASGDLQDAINSAFGDFNSFKAQLTAAASSVFGSGWAWLIVADGGLAITTTPNQNSPLQTALAAGTNTTIGIPILGIDVWEHAYYLKHYQNRAGWIANFFLVLNWAQISENYNYAAAGGVPDTSETPVLTSYPPTSSDLPCTCSLPAGYDVNQNDLAGTIKAAGDCPADPSEGCPSGNFGFGNSGGCGNVGCNNTGTGNTGNNNIGTGNKGDNNNGSNNTGRCLDGTDQTGDSC